MEPFHKTMKNPTIPAVFLAKTEGYRGIPRVGRDSPALKKETHTHTHPTTAQTPMFGTCSHNLMVVSHFL